MPKVLMIGGPHDGAVWDFNELPPVLTVPHSTGSDDTNGSTELYGGAIERYTYNLGSLFLLTREFPVYFVAGKGLDSSLTARPPALSVAVAFQLWQDNDPNQAAARRTDRATAPSADQGRF